MDDFEKSYNIVDGDRQNLLRVKVRRRDGEWIAAAELVTSAGPIRFIAAASEETVRKTLERRGEAAKTGDFLGALKKLARGKVLRSIFNTVKAITRNPTIMQIASAIPYVGTAMQGIKTAVDLTDKAGKLIAKAKSGHKGALMAVQKIATAAKAGNPLAADTVRVMKGVVDRAKEAARPVAISPQRVPSSTWDELQGSPDVVRDLQEGASTFDIAPPVAAGAYDIAIGRAPQAWPRGRPALPPHVVKGLLNMIKAARAA